MKKFKLFLLAGLLLTGMAAQAANEVYTEFYKSTKTMYYRYDSQRAYAESVADNVELYTPGNADRFKGYRQSVEKIIIDANLKKAPLTSFENMFSGYKSTELYWLTNVKTIEGLENLNTENVTNMYLMFYGMQNLEELDLSSFNTANVENMRGMFYECKKLQTLDLTSFDMSKVSNAELMFYNCAALTTIYCEQDLSASTTLTKSSNMFYGCTNLKGYKGTSYDSDHRDKSYARVDGGTEAPGYFSKKPWDGNLATVTEDVVAVDGTVITGTLSGNYKISIADEAIVTLKDAVINGTKSNKYKWAGLTCEGDADIQFEGTNKIVGFDEHYSGIYVPEGKTLTISGTEATATLEVGTNGYCAGIGAGDYLSCGNIYFMGLGTITAKGGGNDGAGIGGANHAGCGNIWFQDYEYTVIAIGGDYSPAIGGGGYATCGNITISGKSQKITATGGKYADYSVGKGYRATAIGTISVNGKEYTDGIAENPFEWPVWDGNLATVTEDVVAKDGVTITGTLAAAHKISIADGAKVTLKDADINGDGSLKADFCGITCLGDAEITLEGTNKVVGMESYQAAINAPVGKTLTIKGEGALEAIGGAWTGGFGINGVIGDVDFGNLVIEGGIITAKGTAIANGIGIVGSLTISGGTVEVISGDGGIIDEECSAISACGDIQIMETVTKVTATSQNPEKKSIIISEYCDPKGKIYIGGEDKGTSIAENPFVYPTDPTAVENVTFETVRGEKFVMDGKLFIEHNGRTYNVLGAEVK